MHCCYFLYNDINNTTYNGYTSNLTKRLRQHNGEIKGGARSTKKLAGNWKYLAVVTNPDLDKTKALSLEWHLRYPTNKKPRPKEYQGPQGRLNSISTVLENPKFLDIPFTVYIAPEYADKLPTGRYTCSELAVIIPH